MPRLRTDDGPRKLRAVWLGPAGHTLPFQWTYVQWAVTLIAVPIAGTIGTAIVYALFGDPVWAFGLGGLWFGAGGVYLAVGLMRNVTFDEPLGYQRRLVKGEFSRQFSQPVGPRRVCVEFEHPPIGYLAGPVRRAMGWDTDAQRPLAAVPPSGDGTARPADPCLVPAGGSTAATPRPNPYVTPRANPYVTSPSA